MKKKLKVLYCGCHYGERGFKPVKKFIEEADSSFDVYMDKENMNCNCSGIEILPNTVLIIRTYCGEHRLNEEFIEQSTNRLMLIISPDDFNRCSKDGCVEGCYYKKRGWCPLEKKVGKDIRNEIKKIHFLKNIFSAT
jgi:hypothetical protein